MPTYHAIIATTNLQLSALQQRLQSRFKVHRFEGVSLDAIALFITTKWTIPHDVAMKIAQSADGDVRQSLNDTEAYLEAKEAA